MTKPVCSCKTLLLYVQRVYEYHTIQGLSEDCVELMNLDETVCDEEFEPYLLCPECEKRFNLKSEEILC